MNTVESLFWAGKKTLEQVRELKKSKDSIKLFTTKNSIHIFVLVPEKRGIILHLQLDEMLQVRSKLLKYFNLLFCFMRMSYSRCSPKAINDYIAFYQKVQLGLFTHGNNYYNIIKCMEAYTTACILSREGKYADKQFINKLLEGCHGKVPATDPYAIDKLGINEFMTEHGVTLAFEVFYCQKAFG